MKNLFYKIFRVISVVIIFHERIRIWIIIFFKEVFVSVISNIFSRELNVDCIQKGCPEFLNCKIKKFRF